MGYAPLITDPPPTRMEAWNSCGGHSKVLVVLKVTKVLLKVSHVYYKVKVDKPESVQSMTLSPMGGSHMTWLSPTPVYVNTLKCSSGIFFFTKLVYYLGVGVPFSYLCFILIFPELLNIFLTSNSDTFQSVLHTIDSIPNLFFSSLCCYIESELEMSK